jgi:3-oxoacyl-[acyl-carrier-protein] synthase-3
MMAVAGRTRIRGIGRCVPPGVVTNDDLSQRMETDDEWIQQRSGIRERHHISEDTGAADLGAVAAREAMQRAGVESGEIDCVMFATLSPDYDMPSSACVLQERLGISGVPAFDIRNQCTGFLYGLTVANAFLQAGRFDKILLVGGEVHSTGVEFTTRGRQVAVLFGDGAGAVVLDRGSDPQRGILSTHLHSEGKYAEKLWLQGVEARAPRRLTAEMITGDDPTIYPKMVGRYVFKHAVTRSIEAIQEAVEANGYAVSDLDLLVPHQANLRINQAVAATLEFPEEKVVNNIQTLGNTTAATIPLALYDALEDGRLREGSLVCVVAFGAGFTWASALLRW